MEITAEVFKSGNSLAVRLPNTLRVRAKELVIERGIDGEIVLYDKKARERSWQKRRKALHELIQQNRAEAEAAIAAGSTEDDFKFPRFEDD